MRRRHPDVKHRNVGPVIVDHAQRRFTVGNGRDNIYARLGEQSRESFAQQHRVLGDYDSHGNSTVRTVGPPTGLSIRREPSTPPTRSVKPASPLPGCAIAPPTPSSRIVSRKRSPTRRATMSARLAPECLAMLASASLTTKYAIASIVGLQRGSTATSR